MILKHREKILLINVTAGEEGLYPIQSRLRGMDGEVDRGS
jgi:hypothetical protein